MEIETIADVKLVSRALTSGWMDGADDKRAMAVEALFAIVTDNPDPELKIRAFEALAKADAVDLKRYEAALKKQEADERKRLKLLEVLASLPAGAVAQIAHDHRALDEC